MGDRYGNSHVPSMGSHSATCHATEVTFLCSPLGKERPLATQYPTLFDRMSPTELHHLLLATSSSRLASVTRNTPSS